MTAQDVSLVQKPLAMDVLMKIILEDGITKTDIMRGYHDTMCKTVHYRISEMFHAGWIEYRMTADDSRRIFATNKGQFINSVVDSMLIEVEDIT